jgi:hypothetical protein
MHIDVPRHTTDISINTLEWGEPESSVLFILGPSPNFQSLKESGTFLGWSREELKRICIVQKAFQTVSELEN